VKLFTQACGKIAVPAIVEWSVEEQRFVELDLASEVSLYLSMQGPLIAEELLQVPFATLTPKRESESSGFVEEVAYI